jgi:DNA-directed RNA polymerase specialized sigma24 family protein
MSFRIQCLSVIDNNKPINFKILIKGDKEAWDAFVNRFSSLIYSAIYRVLSSYLKKIDQWDLNEVFQEVFIRLIKDDYHLLKSYNPSRASLSTWLTIISRSTAIDFLRRRPKQHEPLQEDHIASPPHKSTVPSIDIPYHLLSGQQKLVLTLLFDKDYDTAKIADILRINIQTVRSTKHKALEKLRKYFKSKKGDNPKNA